MRNLSDEFWDYKLRDKGVITLRVTTFLQIGRIPRQHTSEISVSAVHI